jgi:hypothetical protein
MARKSSKRLVIDASVARSFGSTEPIVWLQQGAKPEPRYLLKQREC